MLKRLAIVVFCLLAIASLAIAEEAGQPEALINLVKQDCGSCHGLTLKGGLGPDIRPAALAHYDIDTLSGVVLDGIPDTAMPPWRPILSEGDARKIAEYLLKGDLK
ncbi:c-type cytochrome [Roseibium salinum]|uniref:Cytochrome c n=1 Tax=Roseibium salinum TaxID=1604349 RepID=A0ABT3R6J9_9HYPH|nr:cytochrome c [Roseibium sp. DSM 29163]MCX2724658.1 cytochrome c [Roseibium sp. DSM 29163]MDN3721356.1 cytochrome c [Roseibium salinum]